MIDSRRSWFDRPGLACFPLMFSFNVRHRARGRGEAERSLLPNPSKRVAFRHLFGYKGVIEADATRIPQPVVTRRFAAHRSLSTSLGRTESGTVAADSNGKVE